MQELARGKLNGIKLFEGEASHLVPSCDCNVVSSCFFVFVDKIIVHSFQYKRMQRLAGYLTSCHRRDTALEHLVLEDIPDPCVRQILKEV